MILTAFHLTSCENFLNAGKVSDEIKDAIAYNNAKTVNVSIECKEDMGTVFPQLSYQAKVGYPFEVQFIPNTENYIIRDLSTIFQAVNRIDKEQSRADCVEFKVADQTFEDKKAGLYRIEVKVVKYADDIQITPDCIPCPAIKATSPEHSTIGHYANTPVVFTFNIPIENDNSNEAVFYYGENSITIISNEGEMSKFFDKPVFNTDKTKLTLTPKAKELSDFIKKKNLDYLDIRVSFSSDISIVQNGVQLSFVQNDYSSFAVRYMEKIEKNAPVLVSDTFFATRHNLCLSDAETFATDKKCLIKTLGNFQSDDEYLKNRIRNELFICGKYFDAESGVKSIVISEQLTNDFLGYEVSYSPETYEFYVLDENENAEFVRDEEGYIDFCIKLKSNPDIPNGALLIKITALDYCNNESTIQQFTVFKKYFDDELFETKSISNIYDIKISNAKSFLTDFYHVNTQRDFDEQIYDDLIKTLYCEDRVSKLLYTDRTQPKSIFIPLEYYTVLCEYKDEQGNIYSEAFDKENNQETYILNSERKLSVSKTSGMNFKIKIYDDMGNIAQKDYSFPDLNKIRTVTYNGGSVQGGVELQYLFGFEEKAVAITKSIWIPEAEEGETVKALGGGDETNLYPGEYRYILGLGDEKGVLFSDISKQTINVSIISGSCSNVVYTKSLSKNTENGWTNVTLNISQGNEFDSVYAVYHDADKEDTAYKDIWRVTYLEQNSPSIIFRTPTKLLFNEGLEVFLYGTKDGKRSQRNFTIWASAADDNYYPKYSITRSDYEHFLVTATDIGSGMKQGSVTINRTGKLYEIKSDDSFKVEIPVNELILGENEITVYLEDNNNNKPSVKDTIYLDYNQIQLNTVTKTNNGWTLSTNTYNGFIDESDVCIETSLLGTNGKWTAIEHQSFSATKNEDNSISVDIPSSIYSTGYSFLKVMLNTGLKYGGAPLYIYAGTANPNGYFDYILPNTNESVLVMSDGPTYIHTVSTPTDYEVCKDWTVEQWETYNHTFGDVYWAGSNTVPRNYQIDMNNIRSGDSYCVIAYFVKGKPAKSAVMVKP